MSCKWKKVENNVCKIKGKQLAEYECNDCPMKIEDANNNIKKTFRQIWGDEVINEIFGGKK